MSVESPKISGLISMRYVISSILNRLNQYDYKSYKRLMQIGIEGLTEMNLYHTKESIEVVYLHMSVAKVVSLPADYIDYRKIGFPQDGKLRVISKSDNLLLPRTYYGSMVNGVLVPDDGLPVGNADAGNENGTTSAVYFAPHYYAGNFIGGLYGMPGGMDTAYYRIDIENRQIVFSGSTPRSEIVMEYISTGQKSDGSSLIPREVVPALRTYIIWQKDIYDPRVAVNLKEMSKREHEEAVAALRSFQLSFSADEYLQMSRSSLHQSIKR